MCVDEMKSINLKDLLLVSDSFGHFRQAKTPFLESKRPIDGNYENLPVPSLIPHPVFSGETSE